MEKRTQEGERYARVDHVHTTLEARVKVALAATTSEDLSLDHELILAYLSALYPIPYTTDPDTIQLKGWVRAKVGLTETLGNRLGLLGRERRQSLGGGDTVLLVSCLDLLFPLVPGRRYMRQLKRPTEFKSCTDWYSWMDRCRRWPALRVCASAPPSLSYRALLYSAFCTPVYPVISTTARLDSVQAYEMAKRNSRLHFHPQISDP